jgi:hypothetical protein
MMRSYNLRSDADIIKLDHVPFLGHEVGQCQVNPKSSQGFVHIPKNASTEMKQLLGDWEFANYKKKSLDEYLVILRDPRDRWISGMTELLVGKNSRIGRENRKWMSSLSDAKKLVDQTLLQQLIRLDPIFDPHTAPQCLFLEGIPYQNITYFEFNRDVVDTIAEYCLIPDVLSNLNETGQDFIKSAVADKIAELVEKDHEIKHEIEKVYHCDHVLIDLLNASNPMKK